MFSLVVQAVIARHEPGARKCKIPVVPKLRGGPDVISSSFQTMTPLEYTAPLGKNKQYSSRYLIKHAGHSQNSFHVC
jgi:hypothetical protein